MTLSDKERHKKLLAMKDKDIDYSDIPELDEEWFKRAKIVFPEPKKAISFRVDKELLAWFKKAAKKHRQGYQAYMHAVLKAYVDDHRDDRNT